MSARLGRGGGALAGRAARLLTLVSIAWVMAAPGVASAKQQQREWDRAELPRQADYPEYGAVILDEAISDEVYFDGEWNTLIRTKVTRSLLYFSDKAEEWATQRIYLDSDIRLREFSARTIKPNGEILTLGEKDLHPTQFATGNRELSDEQSVMFTFPGVEPGAILECSYVRIQKETFYTGKIWAVQESLPKLHTSYSVEIPVIFLAHNYKWNFTAQNMVIGEPKMHKDMVDDRSRKNRSLFFSWENSNIEALPDEPRMPPYRDVAKYVRIDLDFADWNEFSDLYWKRVRNIFTPNGEVRRLAEDLVAGAQSETERIERVFNYVQNNYRYIAVNIGESGYIPHEAGEIIRNRYGDCKDMTVLNVVLLRALGFEANPALTASTTMGVVDKNIVSPQNFNHMIASVKDSTGRRYWLDATGSSCPLGEIPPFIEGTWALVLLPDGTCDFEIIPASGSADNQLVREVKMTMQADGKIRGTAKLTYRGNESLMVRSVLKDATAEDVRKLLQSYLGANAPDVELENLTYSDPSAIEPVFEIAFDFQREHVGTEAGSLLIVKPALFPLEQELDSFRAETRLFPVHFVEPSKITDLLEIAYDPQTLGVESLTPPLERAFTFGRVSASVNAEQPGKIAGQREFSLETTEIGADRYADLRGLYKAVADANELTVVLKRL